MAATAPGAGAVEVSMDDKAKALVAAKIKEGEYKVQMIGQYAVRTDRAIDALEKKVQDIEAVMDLELMLGEYCADLSDMHKARHYYRATSLSEEEKLYLHQIDDFATATIAEYEASVGPVPAFDNHLSLFSQEIPLEFPEPLAPPPASSASASASASASHHEPAVDNGGDVAC
ncbi:hypothetical protein VPH35_084287 [Triticum aestivum]|uniref:uncharacterized protein isoform X3 n=1 Tax=Triticum aestivum TaxID=4565 RepID=UPI000844D9BA|nr:uncharacterized protein LOC123104368 isoform X3 [Triticum aestivum]